jgi:hypothetical protein
MSLGRSKLVFLIIIIKTEYLQEIGLKAIWPKFIPKGDHEVLMGEAGEWCRVDGTIHSFARLPFRSSTGKGI